MAVTAAELDQLTQKIIGCAIEVHRTLGPGLLESVYRECLMIEISDAGMHVQSERPVRLEYKRRRVKGDLKLDLLIENLIIVELKAVEWLHPIHLAQVITYLKVTGLPAALLMNFNEISLRAGIRRLNHPDRYVKKKSS